MSTPRRVMITGGLGFIGHHLALTLNERGHEVFITDCLYHHLSDRKYNDFILERVQMVRNAGIPIEIADVRDVDRMRQLLELYNPDTLVHLAATANAMLCNKNPREGVDMGLMSYCSCLNAIQQYRKPVHVVYYSSSMVYGNFISDEVNEDSPTNPINVYGASKLSCETFSKAYGFAYDFPYTIVRPSALYGPRCINRRITQIFIENILAGKGLTVMGDGESRLDFTDVRDLCNGTALIVEKPEESSNQTFNLTYGVGRSIASLLDILHEEFGEFEVTHKPQDKCVPKRGTLNIDRIKRMLGYEPLYPLEIGYRDLINHYRQRS